MKNKLLHNCLIIFLLLSASAASAHGVHIQELQQSTGGIMAEFSHLFVEHGYWLLVLLAGSGLVAVLTRNIHIHMRQKRK